MLTAGMTLEVSLVEGGRRRIKLVDAGDADAIGYLLTQESDGDFWRTVSREPVDRIDIEQSEFGGTTSRDGAAEVYDGP